MRFCSRYCYHGCYDCVSTYLKVLEINEFLYI